MSKIFFVLALIFLFTVGRIFSQDNAPAGPTVTGPAPSPAQRTVSPPSLKELPKSEIYYGPEEIFSIALPKYNLRNQQVSGERVGVEATGSEFGWTMREADISLTFFLIKGDAVLSADQEQNNLAARLKEVASGKTGGAVTHAKLIKMGDFRGAEVSVTMPTGVKVICRVYSAEHFGRAFQYTLAALMYGSDPDDEALVLKAIDSLKIFSDKGRADDLARRVAEATPADLPQKPAAARAGTDAKEPG